MPNNGDRSITLKEKLAYLEGIEAAEAAETAETAETAEAAIGNNFS